MSQKNPRLIAFQQWVKSNELSTKRVAKESGVPYTTLASFVQGDTYTLKGDAEQKIASHYGVSIEDIFVRGRTTEGRKAISFPLSGKVAAGPDGHFENVYTEGDGGNFITFNPDEITLALEIEGDSMLPRYRHGDKLLFGYRHDDPTHFVRCEVMAQLRDGRKLFKILRKGSRAGLWDLYSINPDFDPIRDVELEWVNPLRWVVV